VSTNGRGKAAKPKQLGESGDSEDTTTAARVIDAAVQCILDEGFYRASSNQIARRAGVTWGVIQYHFGTREGLLLAVFRHSADALLAHLENATITGDTTDERLESLADVIWSYYRRPEFLAYMQILLNLTHDPTTAEDTVTTLATLNERTFGLWQSLIDKALPEQNRSPQTARALFDVLRGLAIGQELTDAIPSVGPVAKEHPDPVRTALIRAFTLLLERSPATA
jgi:AcrR family transcriptional regulator